jgi:hypothetical protein
MTNDGLPVIPAPLDAGEDFHVGPELTVFEAAMIYAGRHPHGGFLRDGTVADHLRFLRAGASELPKGTRTRTGSEKVRSGERPRQSWDIYCELMKRIEVGTIIPVRCAYQRSGELDPVRTRIRLDDVARLAAERGERPKYLRHIQTGETTGKAANSKGGPEKAANSKGGPKYDLARRALDEIYPRGAPPAGRRNERGIGAEGRQVVDATRAKSAICPDDFAGSGAAQVGNGSRHPGHLRHDANAV